ncbi:4-amino-4-deoxy-L-arabinose transferase-like glycosyltransferase [Streptomyces sp. SAI-135]|uniref:ArnT family glycosyltransferase n=1 Tax=unclassified Streptomyces TaxID=2593676 RepID=UPI0024731D2A|nr:MULTISPECIES: glycosyltransferase family 39 protein [unclassified Streptomyces]MDH6517995.1 4-amino-4-deoxy-L-arabinose transferase-like glycosyltransferase [Streptomyces sp. SAI-090]MDH6585779.1 4-amino-4-deoxy-L-arabinose transferase-like glycosyltransferase [Streptomyces sp. SAI-133]MDH6617914.1 4-amino-4-deoxy-L-arabinose transferase-like glycosyltransferase [Streptomyces sp. SAI-135]
MTTQTDRPTQQGSGWGPAATAPGAPAAVPAPSSGEPRQPFVRRLWRGRPEDPRWARPAFLGLLAVTLLLYLYNLSSSGYANSFYSAAVQAGSQSWKAFFFGSLDAGNAITVDKPPASLWPMELSVRIFGLNSWAILAPEVLMGVGTVAVVHASVRRRFSPAAGLIAGAVLALTPVAALMFRFNNPDAMLALLMAVACYLVVRALEDGRTKWLLWAGAAIGFAFLAKTLQAFLILPPLAIVYAVCAPVSVKKRFGQLAAATAALVVSGGWWVAIVELWPASSRPYIGGSQNNSFLELTFGYNGLGRLNGDETGSVGGGGGAGGTGQWGETGWDRMFNSEIGGQISWLLPAALILLVAGLVATRRLKRTSVTRGSFLVWGGSLLMTTVVFSYMAGIFHQYYTVALAPYLAAVIGMGAGLLWERRAELWASITLAASVVAAAAWSYVLLNRTSDYLPWLKYLVLIGGLVAALGLIFAGRLSRRLALAAASLGLVAALAGPTAYTLSTLQEGHTGSIVTAGPAGASMMGGGGPGGGGRGGFGGGMPGQQGQQQNGNGNTQGGGTGGFPGGGMPGGQGQNQQNGNGGTQNQQGGPGGQTGDGGGMGGGGVGGLLNGASVSSEAKKLLETDSSKYTWVAAAIGAQNAASYQLSTGDPVMAIGGFNGTDPSPTLAQFKEYVADGKIHYFISGGSGGGMGGSSSGTSSQITSWVEANFKKVTVGSATFYDLTQKASG